MKRIKEIKISFSEEDRCPRVEIDGASLKCITKLKLDWESMPDEHFKIKGLKMDLRRFYVDFKNF